MFFVLIGCSKESTKTLSDDNTNQNKSSIELKNHADSVSYAVGLDMGTRLKDQFVDINPDIMNVAIKDVFEDNKLLLSLSEKQAVIAKYSNETIPNRLKKLSDKNLTAGEAFLKENANKPGVVDYKGMQYKVIHEGKGAKPNFRDAVKVHYRGRLIDGTVFDDSYVRGEPSTFPLTRVVPGFSEGILLMSEGAKYELYIPGAMGYGTQGGPGGPNALLIFEVELIKVMVDSARIKNKAK